MNVDHERLMEKKEPEIAGSWEKFILKHLSESSDLSDKVLATTSPLAQTVMGGGDK